MNICIMFNAYIIIRLYMDRSGARDILWQDSAWKFSFLGNFLINEIKINETAVGNTFGIKTTLLLEKMFINFDIYDKLDWRSYNFLHNRPFFSFESIFLLTIIIESKRLTACKKNLIVLWKINFLRVIMLGTIIISHIHMTLSGIFRRASLLIHEFLYRETMPKQAAISPVGNFC